MRKKGPRGMSLLGRQVHRLTLVRKKGTWVANGEFEISSCGVGVRPGDVVKG